MHTNIEIVEPLVGITNINGCLFLDQSITWEKIDVSKNTILWFTDLHLGQ